MLEKRKRGRPRIHPTATPPAAGPVVFLTKKQLAERWHMSPRSLTENYRKLGIKKIELNGRWLCALSNVEEIERKKIGTS